MEKIEQIVHDGEILAIIIPSNFEEPGLHFFTPDSFSQQLAYMQHPTGKIIDPHVHNEVPRNVKYTQEVLLIKKGKVRVDFYSNNKEYLESRTLTSGDVILLASGGHGFEMMEETVMIEVKQGPYSGDMDKTRFEPVNENNINCK